MTAVSWYVAGRVPADATEVTVDLSDGSTAYAYHACGFYLAFPPQPSRAAVLRVHVVTPGRTYTVVPGP